MTQAAISLWALLSLVPEPLASEREKIEAITLDADGSSGELRTSPERLSHERSRYIFGRSGCKPLSERTLEVLFQALEKSRLVRIESAQSKDVRCVQGVTIFADP